MLAATSVYIQACWYFLYQSTFTFYYNNLLQHNCFYYYYCFIFFLHALDRYNIRNYRNRKKENKIKCVG